MCSGLIFWFYDRVAEVGWGECQWVGEMVGPGQMPAEYVNLLGAGGPVLPVEEINAVGSEFVLIVNKAFA